MSRIRVIIAHLETLLRSPAKQRVTGIVRLVISVAITAILVVQLSRIGWEAVLREMPSTPWFYVTLVAMYFLLPATEVLIYGPFWPVSRRDLFSVLVRKRVLNVDVLGFSGEVYLHMWARNQKDQSGRQVFRLIVDNGIASSIGSYIAIGLLFSGLLWSDSIALVDVIGEDRSQLLLPVAILAGAGVLVLVRFRHSIFSLPGRSVVSITGLHVLRFFVSWGLQILHWWVVLPDTPFRVWGTMLAVVTITNRLPFVPARDLISTSMILGLGPALQTMQPAIAAMLVSRSVLERLLNATLFAWLSARADRHAVPFEDPVALRPGPDESPSRPDPGDHHDNKTLER